MITKSPVFSIFEETLSGSSTIYAFGRENVFFKRFEDALCTNLQWMLSKEVSNNWAQQRLEILASVVVLSLSLLLVLTSGSVSTSIAAASVVFSLSCGESLNFFTSFLVIVEGSFASVERVKEFSEQLEQEPPWRLPSDAYSEMQKWPGSDPELVFEGVSVRYLPHMPRALDSLSFRLAAREKLGIVGRTGSGKSTVMGALFRLFPLEQGRVLLGGVDTSQTGIGLLRRQITIVPQDPILFSGKLRRNLDPLENCSDHVMWDALKRSSLSELVESLPGGLNANVADGGSNFSVGERQVFCLVRALLRGTQVLCLDEATANVDPTNDARIQRILQEDVAHCVVLTIAHRLRTVLNSDRILVLDGGHLAQLDTPQELLSKQGVFRDLAHHAGITLSDIATPRVVASI
jgi:ABC-type multidrug transport system fused ATPase/permease subunit